VVFIACITNFATGRFEWARLNDSAFWYNYLITLGLSLTMLFLAMMYKKFKNKMTAKIIDILEEIKVLRQTLIDYGWREMFKEFLKRRNKNIKTNKYVNYLANKRDRIENKKDRNRFLFFFELSKKRQAKLDEKVAYYENKILNAKNDVDKVHIKMKVMTENTIYGNYNKKSEDSNVWYTGSEGLIARVVPGIISGAIFACILLAFIPLFYDTVTKEQIINLAVRLYSMLSYAYNGMSFADFSIFEVYYTVLCNRKDEITTFLAEIGHPFNILDNENYKYKAVPNKEIKEANNG
jgi:hypothetical protein